jgi:hypothetical protein
VDVTAQVYRSLKCWDCDRCYPLPKNADGEFKRNKATEVCVVCDSVLRLNLASPTVTAQETFDLWEAHRVTRLEGMLDAAEAA